MAKKMCKLTKKDRPAKIAELSGRARYVCTNCGRTADSAENLCEAVAFEDL